MRTFSEIESKLSKELNGENLELFNELVNASDEISATSGVENFKTGFMLGGQTNGYSYGELVDIANAAIWQCRDMYLRPDFYANNLKKVRAIITPVIEDYKSGKITYAEAEFNARN